MNPVIRLDKLTKWFGAETALNEVSLEVPPGVVFALLGENGAGKTTAIRIMLGLAEANSGHAQVLGLGSANQGLQIRQRVGYVPERPTLYEWMTVEEIGWFTAGFYGNGFLPEYMRLVEQFGTACEKEAENALKRHTGQGRALARLAHQPELLILDEPTSGPGRPGAARVSREHGRSGRPGPNRLPFEPSNRRGRAGGRLRGHPPQGKTAAGRAARSAKSPGAKDHRDA